MIAIGSMAGYTSSSHSIAIGSSYSITIGSSAHAVNRTPLYHAVINKHADATRLLLECGADIIANNTLYAILNRIRDASVYGCICVIKNPCDAMRVLAEYAKCLEGVVVIYHRKHGLIIVI